MHAKNKEKITQLLQVSLYSLFLGVYQSFISFRSFSLMRNKPFYLVSAANTMFFSVGSI
jgi:hypothetical protein|tara:strand:- start:6619 stop:6795 length:177 start_codon:yes stop_codon:yes gene_type:complete